MQGPNIVEVTPEKARELLPLSYRHAGLTVQGASPIRLTPRPNENIEVPNEVGRAIVARNLARRFTESRIAIATVGLGLRPAALTVSGLVRALITNAGLARLVASFRQKEQSSLTPTAAPPSNIEGVPGHDIGKGTGSVHFVDDEVEIDTTAYRFGIPLPTEGIEVEVD